MVQRIYEMLMSMEVDNKLKAGKSERTEGREGYRSLSSATLPCKPLKRLAGLDRQASSKHAAGNDEPEGAQSARGRIYPLLP